MRNWNDHLLRRDAPVQEQKVWPEKVDLVIDPKDAFPRRLHGQSYMLIVYGNQELTARPPSLAGSNTHSAASRRMRVLKSPSDVGGRS